jgi:surfeit locus 1 family protein
MGIVGRQFKPSLNGTLLTGALLAVLVSLGFWQLRRADEKQLLIDQYRNGADTTRSLTASEVDDLPLYQEVIVRGRLDTERQILLDNMPAQQTANGGPGYEVLTPLRLADGSTILIDRGWLPLGRNRAELPRLDVNEEERSVRGRIGNLPSAAIALSSPIEGPWPRVLNFPQWKDLHRLYGPSLLPHIVLLDANEPDGFARDWSQRTTFGAFGPERHIAYAVQWFGLAVALAIIYVVVSLKAPPPHEHAIHDR